MRIIRYTSGMDSGAKVALVTGGAKRVGRAVALGLVDAGYDVAITYLTSSGEAENLVRLVGQRGRKAIAIQADLENPESAIEKIHGEFAAHFDRLDVLVNNASAYIPADLRHSQLPDMRRLWAIHIESPLLLCQKFETFLRAAKGHVVNMVDLLAERPWPEYLPYCASKAALWNLTLGLARSLAPEVTVNGIAPGVVEWPDNYPQAEREKYLKRVPLGRPGTPIDVAQVVRFLVSEGAYITGQIIRLDGGRSIM